MNTDDELQPIDYARPGAFRGSRWLNLIKILSPLVAATTFLIGAFFIWLAVLDRRIAEETIITQKGFVNQGAEQDYSSAPILGTVAALYCLFALLLFVAVIRLWLHHPGAIRLHRVYAASQIALSILTFFALISYLQIFALAAATIGCIYPAIVLVLLRDAQEPKT